MSIPEIEWDDDGYPTDLSLDAFRSLSKMSIKPCDAAVVLRRELEKCAERCCASYDEEDGVDIFNRPVTRVLFSTGGWSGAEDLIDALLDQFWINHLQYQWNRGGHYIFEIPPEPRP